MTQKAGQTTAVVTDSVSGSHNLTTTDTDMAADKKHRMEIDVATLLRIEFMDALPPPHATWKKIKARASLPKAAANSDD